MKVSFGTTAGSGRHVVAQVMAQDAFPADLDAGLREAAGAARFAGKAGQTFEGFTGSGADFRRIALAGLGDATGEARTSAAERAGGALTAKYLTSGETTLAIDFAGADLSASQAAQVLLGAVLRGWRYDIYRTRLTAEQKVSLTEIVAVNAPAGTEAAWATESAIAAGSALTRELSPNPPM